MCSLDGTRTELYINCISIIDNNCILTINDNDIIDNINMYYDVLTHSTVYEDRNVCIQHLSDLTLLAFNIIFLSRFSGLFFGSVFI